MTTSAKKKMRDRVLAENLARQTADMVEEAAAMIGEVTKVLRVQRWQVQDAPFHGFRSPPGRF